jgi:serine/threonine protein kinase
MGEVFRARDTRLDRVVAVKVLPSQFAGDEQLRLRFEREARTISQLEHPHICRLYDIGEAAGPQSTVRYLVMELLDGESLADRLGRGALPIAEVLNYGAQIADALACAHRAGIVHRDLKPGNVMLTRARARQMSGEGARRALGECA